MIIRKDKYLKMLNGKQRAALRREANGIQALYQIGKEGITENVLRQLDDALEARELIKVHVLEGALLGAREASDIIAEELGADGVQAIGNKFVLYRPSSENPKIVLPK